MFTRLSLLGAMVATASAFAPAALPSLSRGSGSALLDPRNRLFGALASPPRMVPWRDRCGQGGTPAGRRAQLRAQIWCGSHDPVDCTQTLARCGLAAAGVSFDLAPKPLCAWFPERGRPVCRGAKQTRKSSVHAGFDRRCFMASFQWNPGQTPAPFA